MTCRKYSVSHTRIKTRIASYTAQPAQDRSVTYICGLLKAHTIHFAAQHSTHYIRTRTHAFFLFLLLVENNTSTDSAPRLKIFWTLIAQQALSHAFVCASQTHTSGQTVFFQRTNTLRIHIRGIRYRIICVRVCAVSVVEPQC